jgi:hypothetical protein
MLNADFVIASTRKGQQSQTTASICLRGMYFSQIFSTLSILISSPFLEVTGLRETPAFYASDSIESISLSIVSKIRIMIGRKKIGLFIIDA